MSSDVYRTYMIEDAAGEKYSVTLFPKEIDLLTQGISAYTTTAITET